MVGRAGSPTGIVHADMTLTKSNVKVKVKGLLNFRQLAKLCMLAAMTAAPFRGFLVTTDLWHGLSVCLSVTIMSSAQMVEPITMPLGC